MISLNVYTPICKAGIIKNCCMCNVWNLFQLSPIKLYKITSICQMHAGLKAANPCHCSIRRSGHFVHCCVKVISTGNFSAHTIVREESIE